MNNELDQKSFEEIESYILETMSPTAKKQFEERMSGNVELANEVDRMRDQITAVELGAFSSSIQNIAQEYQQSNPSIDQKKRNSGLSTRLLSIAAGLAVLIGSAMWIMGSQSTTEHIYAEEFTPDPGLPVIMGTTDNYEFQDAMVDYKAEKYDSAIRKWSELAKESDPNDTLNYFIACAFMNQDKMEEAGSYFTEVLSQKNSAFHDKAVWFAALSYFRSEDQKKLESLTSSISAEYKERYERLLQSLEE